MVINVLRGRGSPRASDDGVEGLPIGAEGSPDVFSCPTCARPLAIGTSRCRGCGTILLVGVPARRASLFIAIGAVIGLMAGAAVATALADPGRGRPATVAVNGSGPPALIAPSVTTLPALADPTSPTAGGARPTAGIPAAAASALRLTITVDDRLAAGESSLAAALRGSVDPVAVAATLRAMAGDAAWGTDVVGRLADWPAAADLQARLRDAYASVAATARDGLGSSLTSTSGYRTAAVRMTALTERLAELRAKTVALATSNGISLPRP